MMRLAMVAPHVTLAMVPPRMIPVAMVPLPPDALYLAASDWAAGEAPFLGSAIFLNTNR